MTDLDLEIDKLEKRLEVLYQRRLAVRGCPHDPAGYIEQNANSDTFFARSGCVVCNVWFGPVVAKL